MHKAARRTLELSIEALRRVNSSGADRTILRDLLAADLDRITRAQLDALARLAWKHRRQLPAHLAPELNPDDPIVRAMRQKELAHV